MPLCPLRQPPVEQGCVELGQERSDRNAAEVARVRQVTALVDRRDAAQRPLPRQPRQALTCVEDDSEGWGQLCWYLVLGEGTSGLVPCPMSACG